jgi:hypothetical protein
MVERLARVILATYIPVWLNQPMDLLDDEKPIERIATGDHRAVARLISADTTYSITLGRSVRAARPASKEAASSSAARKRSASPGSRMVVVHLIGTWSASRHSTISVE